MVSLLYPEKVNSEEKLFKLIKQCKIYLPNSKKTNFLERRIFDQREITIDKCIRINFHDHTAESKKQFWKSYSVATYSKKNKTYLEAFKLSHPQHGTEDFVYEHYMGGYDRKIITPKFFLWDNGRYTIEVIETLNYKLFIIKCDSKYSHIGILNNGMLVKFYHIKNDIAYYHFPITNSDESKLSHKIVYYGFGALTYVAATYLYFQSFFISLFIVAFATGALYINDAVNPRRNPIINIIQAIIYAVIFFFLR